MRLVVVAAAALVGCAGEGGPRLDAVSPVASPRSSPSSIRVVIPAFAKLGATHLIATVDDRSSNALVFEVLP